MSFGFFIWLFVAIGILSFAGWSFWVQIKQKKAWESFAKKYQLNFDEKGLFETPRMEGYLQDRYVRLYESVEFNAVGKQVKRIIAEVDLKLRPGTGLFIMPRNQQHVFTTLNLPSKIEIDAPEWDKTHLIGTIDEDEARAYLTSNRLYELNKFLNMRGRFGFYIAGPERSLLMLQFSHALDDPNRIQSLFKAMISVATAIEEDKKLVPRKKPAPKKEAPRKQIEKPQKSKKEKQES